jgi:hypothetical protein
MPEEGQRKVGACARVLLGMTTHLGTLTATEIKLALERLDWLDKRDDFVCAILAGLLFLLGCALYFGVAFFALHHNEAPTTGCLGFGSVAMACSGWLVKRVIQRRRARRRRNHRRHTI